MSRVVNSLAAASLAGRSVSHRGYIEGVRRTRYARCCPAQRVWQLPAAARHRPYLPRRGKRAQTRRLASPNRPDSDGLVHFSEGPRWSRGERARAWWPSRPCPRDPRVLDGRPGSTRFAGRTSREAMMLWFYTRDPGVVAACTLSDGPERNRWRCW